MSIKEAVAKIETEALVEALTLTNGSVTESADLLGKSREWVRRHCNEHKIKPEKFRLDPVEWRATFRGDVRPVMAKTESEALSRAVRMLKISKANVTELTVEKVEK
jgi:hypothetical protein